MKYLTLVILMVILATGSTAQQVSQRTQFLENQLMYNPGFAGVNNYIPFALNVRKQWMGIDDAPSSQALSVSGYVGRGMGVGISMYNDVAGPVRNTGLNLSTARHFKVAQISRDEFTWISAGMGALLYQYAIDGSKLTTTTPGDPAIAQLLSENGQLTFDLSFGLYLSHKNIYAGLSAVNLIQNRRNLYTNEFSNNNLKRIYYLIAGYTYPVNPDLTIEPALLVKYTESGVLQPDILVKAKYRMLYAGLVFRPGDAMAGLFGIELDEFLQLHYSYDYNVNDLNVYSQGTHEVTLGIKIFEPISRDGEVKKEKERPKRLPRGPRK